MLIHRRKVPQNLWAEARPNSAHLSRVFAGQEWRDAEGTVPVRVETARELLSRVCLAVMRRNRHSRACVLLARTTIVELF